MAFTYSVAGTTDKDRVRRRIGDTVDKTATNESLHDEEIADLVTTEGSFAGGLAASAESLAAKLSLKATEKEAKGVRVSYEKRVDWLIDLARSFRSGLLRAATAEPFAGGLSKTELDDSAADTDLVQPAFRREQFVEAAPASVEAEETA